MFADTMSEPELTDSLCYGAWRLRALEAIEFDLQETLLLDDTLQAIKCIRRLRAMPRWPTAAEFKPQASQELTRIEKLSKGIRRIPMVEQIKVSQDASMPVQLLLDGPKLELRAMPTDLLIRYRRLADGRDVIGTIDFDSKLPDVVTLSMDLEVVLNGRVAAALEQQLTKTGESFEGIFLDWQPKPRLTNIPGIVSINSSLAGNVLHLDLGLDTRRAHILLWRLSSDEGVPFEFDWVDASDAAAQRVRPPLHLLLRLTRRSVQPIPIQVQDFVVRNIGPHDVYLDYFTQKTDQVVNRKQRVWRALAIPKNGVSVFLKAGQSVSCSNFKIMDLSTLQVLNAEPVIGDVPPDSLRFEVGTDPLEEFSRVAGLLEKLILRNRVPAFDATRQVQLRAVEISVTPLQEGAIMNELRVGPISLAPADSVGSEFQVPFFGGGRITGFHIEGTAYYVGGGKDDFKTDVGKIGSFDVTSEILNPIPLN